ncbi:MAG TPA: TIR domain-containing protein [Steroidobacteraceae bacterium]|jgi:TolB-like protein
MPQASRSVFLSYASEDAEPARRICDVLRAAGIEVWFNQSELRSGDAWDQKIRQQIRDCSLFLPIISVNTDARTEGYFRLEWKLAVERSRLIADDAEFLIPIVIDATPDAAARVPDRFREVQWSRLPAGETPAVLVERISQLLSREPAQAPTDVRAAAKPPVHRVTAPQVVPGPTSKRLLLLIATLAVMGVGYFVTRELVVPQPDTHSAPSQTVPVRTGIQEKSIAVLPFVDMSEKKDQEYFSDGLSEELIDQLARNTDLKVIARTSSFSFKGKNEDVRSIATKLGVANLLEGSVRKAGPDLRITAQLIRASDGVHLWSQSYERKLDNVFQLQAEISTTVAKALNAALAGNVPPPADQQPDAETYTLILKAKYFTDRANKGDLVRANGVLKEAVQRDPNSSPAWAYLAGNYVFQGFEGDIPLSDARAAAFGAVQRALAIDPLSAQAHRRLGNILSAYDWDWDAATLEYEQAVKLDPTGSDGRNAKLEVLGTEFLRTGKADELIDLARAEVERNPLDSTALEYLGSVQYYAGRLTDAAKTYQALLEIDPGYSNGQSTYALVLLLLGRTTEALTVAGKVEEEPLKLRALACIQWTLGLRANSDESLHALAAKYSKDNPYSIAEVYAYRHEANAAFDSLERAFQQRSSAIVNLNTNPLFNAVRGDPRFKAMLSKLKLVE